ncbi:hypothetical protein [Natrinema soli]|uniref:Uncharacterized protein n=1 Tax=Natrinema soli TaxID=1930624 RepID=A0ABD5SNF6_9EURY|nr:hypothetical protein [Natrinema soli]
MEVRQSYFDNGEFLNYYGAYDQLKSTWNYEVLPSQVAQQTMKQVDRGFTSFFNLGENKYDADVSPPSYLPKDGFYTLDTPHSRFRSTTTTFGSEFRERTATSSTAT